MRRIITVGLAAALAIFAARALFADEGEDMFQEIIKLSELKISNKGKTNEAYIAEVSKGMNAIIDKCEDYKKQFPNGPRGGEVNYEEAKAYFYVSRFVEPHRELLDKGADCAGKSIEIDPKLESAAMARGLLIQYYLMNNKLEEALKQAQAIATDFEDNPDLASLALSYVASIYEKMNKPDEAATAYQKLVEKYPESSAGKKAAGKLASGKIKGSVVDVAFTTTDGKARDIRDYRNRVVLLYFWASTDASSTSSMASIMTFEKFFREKEIAVIGVSLDKDKDVMEAHLKKTGVDWPQYWDGKKWDNALAVKFGVTAYPMTVLIDKTGKVRETGLFGNALIDAIKKLLDEKAN